MSCRIALNMHFFLPLTCCRMAMRASSGAVDRDDPGIHDVQSLLVDDHRVEVHVPDLRVLYHEIGDLNEEVSEACHIGRLSASNTSENRSSADVRDHLRRILLRERHDPKRDVPEDLDQDPAEP